MQIICTCVCQYFHPSCPRPILSVPSVQKFQQPKRIIYKNKFKSHIRWMSRKITTSNTIYKKKLQYSHNAPSHALRIHIIHCLIHRTQFKFAQRNAFSIHDCLVLLLHNPFIPLKISS